MGLNGGNVAMDSVHVVFMLYRLWTLSVKRDPAQTRKKSASSKNQNYFITGAANSIRIAIDALINLQAEQPHYIYNTITTPDRYPLQNMKDLANGLHGCTVFSKIDLVKEYHKVPITATEIPSLWTV
jgi:hypothetical protein